LSCALAGHDELLHFEKNRVSLICCSCGHETPGWDVSGPRPAITVVGDRSRHKLAIRRAQAAWAGESARRWRNRWLSAGCIGPAGASARACPCLSP